MHRTRVLSQRIRTFFNFVKIEHTLFSLPLIYSGAFLAAKEPPSALLLVLILTAATGARTAALALNRIIDREIDHRNPRTAIRELASGRGSMSEGATVLARGGAGGRMSMSEATTVLAVGVAMYLVSAALISPFCLLLSPLPLLVFTIY